MEFDNCSMGERFALVSYVSQYGEHCWEDDNEDNIFRKVVPLKVKRPKKWYQSENCQKTYERILEKHSFKKQSTNRRELSEQNSFLVNHYRVERIKEAFNELVEIKNRWKKISDLKERGINGKISKEELASLKGEQLDRHPLQEQPEPFQENVIASTDNFVELNQTETEKLSSDDKEEVMEVMETIKEGDATPSQQDTVVDSSSLNECTMESDVSLLEKDEKVVETMDSSLFSFDEIEMEVDLENQNQTDDCDSLLQNQEVQHQIINGDSLKKASVIEEEKPLEGKVEHCISDEVKISSPQLNKNVDNDDDDNMEEVVVGDDAHSLPVDIVGPQTNKNVQELEGLNVTVPLIELLEENKKKELKTPVLLPNKIDDEFVESVVSVDKLERNDSSNLFENIMMSEASFLPPAKHESMEEEKEEKYEANVDSNSEYQNQHQTSLNPETSTNLSPTIPPVVEISPLLTKQKSIENKHTSAVNSVVSVIEPVIKELDDSVKEQSKSPKPNHRRRNKVGKRRKMKGPIVKIAQATVDVQPVAVQTKEEEEEKQRLQQQRQWKSSTLTILKKIGSFRLE